MFTNFVMIYDSATGCCHCCGQGVVIDIVFAQLGRYFIKPMHRTRWWNDKRGIHWYVHAVHVVVDTCWWWHLCVCMSIWGYICYWWHWCVRMFIWRYSCWLMVRLRYRIVVIQRSGILWSIHLTSHMLNSPSCLTPVEVSLDKVFKTEGVDGPHKPSTIWWSTTLHEAFVGGQCMSDTATPCALSRPEVRILVQQPIVDVLQHQLSWGDAQQSLSYHGHIRLHRLLVSFTFFFLLWHHLWDTTRLIKSQRVLFITNGLRLFLLGAFISCSLLLWDHHMLLSF